MPTKPEQHALAVAQELAQARPMRRGSLSERYVRCNKPGCVCRERPDSRHGPYFSVTRVVSGRTRSFWVPADRVDVARRQVQAAREFRRRMDEYWRACEEWADAELSGIDAPAAEAGEKGGSGKLSRKRSRRRSTS